MPVEEPVWIDVWFDYGAEGPVWWDSTGMVRLTDFPITDELRAELTSMQEVWNVVYDHDEDLKTRGWLVLARLREELPSSWMVTSRWLEGNEKWRREELARRMDLSAKAYARQVKRDAYLGIKHHYGHGHPEALKPKP